jgi:uncharacterized membrane protein YdcZ (DUF606 family)
MKAYVITTGAVFALIILAHIVRMFAEGWHLLKEPSFALASLLAVALLVWAIRLFRQFPRSP